MAKRVRRGAQEQVNTIIKNTINTMIKSISIIAIFISLGVILLLYLGPEIKLATSMVFRLAVPSVLLAISILIVYELWLQNGRRSASDEIDYQELLKLYTEKSDSLYYPTLQEFLDSERKRRYEVEYDRITRLLDREKALLSKLENNPNKDRKDKRRIRKSRKTVNIFMKAREYIQVDMPYEKSEEFDYLRYNIQDVIYKEYSPDDANRYLKKKRSKKYFSTVLYSVVGLNLLSIGGSMGNIWVAIIMTTLSAISLVFAIVSGFSAGYHSINVISTGIYKTANSFLDQAVAYCKRTHKDLYYKGATEFREPKPIEIKLPLDDKLDEEIDIFAKAAREVTNFNNSRI